MGWFLFWIVWTLLAFIAGMYAKTKFDTVLEPIGLAKSGVTDIWKWARAKWQK